MEVLFDLNQLSTNPPIHTVEVGLDNNALISLLNRDEPRLFELGRTRQQGSIRHRLGHSPL